MIRLIGVITGSALAIALLLLVLGVPELGGQPETATPAAAVEQPQPASEQLSVAEPVPEPEPVAKPEPVAQPAPVTKPEPVAKPEPAPETPVPADLPPEPQPLAVDTLIEESAPTQNWYAFWSPFRSRIAADGFVSELSRTTGLDYRVVKLKPGVFEVAVAYSDDDDIEDKLARIATATGLDMSGG